MKSTNKAQQEGIKRQSTQIEQNKDVLTNTNKPQQKHIKKHEQSTTRMCQQTPT
jgi:hypothetical protein